MSLERNVKKKVIQKKNKEIILEKALNKKKNQLSSITQTEKIDEKKLVSFEKLTNIEKDVLVIAKEVFKLKKYGSNFSINDRIDIERYPIIGKLFSTCISKLHYSKGYSKKQIFLAIRNLEDKGWIVSKGRRTKLEILNDENYKSVIEFIRNNPGIHALDNRIQEKLGITRSPFIKKIIVLLHYKIIRAHKIGKTVHFFLENTPSHYDELKALFLNPLILNLIIQISKNIYVSGIQLGNILNEPVHKIHYYLKKLKDLKIINKWKDETSKRYYKINKFLLSNYNEVFKEPNFINLVSFSDEQ